MTTQQAIASIAGNLRQPMGKKFKLPRGAFIFGIAILVAAIVIPVALALNASDAPASAQAPLVSAPAANGLQRLKGPQLANTPEALLGDKMLGNKSGATWSPRAFTDDTTVQPALQACHVSIAKSRRMSGGTPTNTILEGTTNNGVIQSITWRHDLKSSVGWTDGKPRTATGVITLNFTRVAGEVKISGVSC